MTTVEQPPDPRSELIADLRAFADLLERRPDMLLGDYPRANVQYSVLTAYGDEATRIGEVERMAARLGVEVEHLDRCVMATLASGRVTYVVHTGTDIGDALYRAEDSYRDAVEPETAGAR